MRFSPSRLLSCLCLLMGLLLTWTLLRHSRSYTQTCHHSEAFQDGLHALSDRVHRLLASLGITHFLCYGALWGQLRLSRTLPWERDIELCVLNEEIALKDEVFLERQFRKNNMQLVYDSTDGKYRVTDTTVPDARIELIVFEEDPMVGMLRRVGWKRRVLPSDCESLPSLSCFPPRLVKAPLPSREFGGYIVPVPREGIEIQKYHYPDNWWKEVLPKNC
ncbi:uncharacterized protein LOC128987900 [Macrosteles quadrilineatus]|uniref:uncharacterized protein LOC128987900 n=1 Tax=Macrosteles quadrilineatus TaxID=74068 RepID=UPI0023E1F79F|nr:uncharacterized protein LOC128987900 [Macrosteles quadrilineatus]